MMQLQLVTSMTRPDSPAAATAATTAVAAAKSVPQGAIEGANQCAATDGSTRPPEVQRAAARGLRVSAEAADDRSGGAAAAGGGSGVESSADRASTPERAWRKWVQPMARPQPITSKVSVSTLPPPANTSASRPNAEPAQTDQVGTQARRVASTAAPVADPGEDARSFLWREEWKKEYMKAAAQLAEQSGLIASLGANTSTTTAMPPPPASMPPPHAAAAGGMLAGSGAGSYLASPMAGTACGLTPPSDWSPGPCGTSARAASIGTSTVGSRLSYQWPANLSLATPFHESNSSTPSRSPSRPLRRRSRVCLVARVLRRQHNTLRQRVGTVRAPAWLSADRAVAVWSACKGCAFRRGFAPLALIVLASASSDRCTTVDGATACPTATDGSTPPAAAATATVARDE